MKSIIKWIKVEKKSPDHPISQTWLACTDPENFLGGPASESDQGGSD